MIRHLRWLKLWHVLGALMLAAVLVLALLPDPGIKLDMDEGDKLEHIIAFAALMGWYGNIYTSWASRLCCALIGVGFGIGIELLQWCFPPRDASIYDVLADMVGIALACVLLVTPLARVLPAIEKLFGRRISAHR